MTTYAKGYSYAQFANLAYRYNFSMAFSAVIAANATNLLAEFVALQSVEDLILRALQPIVL